MARPSMTTGDIRRPFFASSRASFAQVVAGAALALEISASAAMATAGSENFFRAHHERGGLR